MDTLRYFPTTNIIIDKMVKYLDSHTIGFYKTGDVFPLLEPSAGEGAILDRYAIADVDFPHPTTESTFFKIRLHKKGTVHLSFKDEKLLDEFNLRLSKILPVALKPSDG